MDEIILRVQEPDAVTLQYVEAKLKPEVVGHATPTEQAQTVTPAPGTTFSAVELDAIPPEYVVPSGTLDITENAEDINVRDKAAVNVNVQPNLQTPDPITPTKQQQIVTADAGYDGLSSAIVEPIPEEYIVPSGKITLTENAADVDIRQFAMADIAVPTERTPVLIDTIDISDFAEPVNRVNIDMSQYAFDGLTVIYIVMDKVEVSKNDWLYFSAGRISGTYIGSGHAVGGSEFNCKKIFFCSIAQNEWRNMIHNGNGYPMTGDEIVTGIGNISFYLYYQDTKFTNGRFLIYGL